MIEFLIVYPLAILVATAASTGALVLAGKIIGCNGPVAGFAIASLISILISFIPIPFVGIIAIIANLFLLKYVTGEDIFPSVLLLVIVAFVVQIVCVIGIVALASPIVGLS